MRRVSQGKLAELIGPDGLAARLLGSPKGGAGLLVAAQLVEAEPDDVGEDALDVAADRASQLHERPEPAA